MSPIGELNKNTNTNPEITALENQIEEENTRITAFYTQIGKMYFENYADNPDQLFAGLVNAINSSNEKIEQCKKDIKKASGIVTCPGCNADIQDGTPFCPHCGYRLMEEAPVTLGVFCVKCGAPISEGTTFCTSCGTKVVTPVSEPNSEPAPQPIPEPAPQPIIEPAPQPISEPAPQPIIEPAPLPTVRKCPNCGKEVSAKAKFCIGCGAKLVNLN